MDFETMALNRQSTRNFADKEVELEKLEKICEVSLLAPSACNSQPWKLHIITKNYPKLDELRKSLQVVGLNKFLNNVDNYIVVEQVFGNMSATMGSKMSKNDLNSIDIGILTSYITFEAMQLGLGTCILGAFRKDKMQKAMGFDKKQVVRIVVAVGYPSENDFIRKKARKSKEKAIEIH